MTDFAPRLRAVTSRRNLKKTRAPETVKEEIRIGPVRVLGLSVWLGLLVGLAELALTRAQKPLTDPSPDWFRMNRHIVWTVPSVDLVMFVLGGLVAALVLRARPRLGVRAVVGPLAFLAWFTLLLSCRWLHVLACMAIAILLTSGLTRRIEMRPRAFIRLVRWSLPVLAVLNLSVVGLSLHAQRLILNDPDHSSPAPSTAAGRPAPNVLLVVLDTVRADHLSLYGYSRNTTPNLSWLARRGITFVHARSTAPWTLPSHASMMTGLWPHELSAGINRPLDGMRTTLAEYLAGHGYRTAGFVANAMYCGVETGLSRGFEHFEDHGLSAADVLWTSALGQRVLLQGPFRPERRTGGNPVDYHRKDANQVRRDMLDWLERQQGRPFFAFLNLYDGHDPYITPADHSRRFSTPPGSDRDTALFERWFIQDKKKLTQAQIQSVLDAYDDGIAYLDHVVGELIDDLDWLSRLHNTLVIITADHGEHLGEHGLYGHASSLYDAEIRVPLLIMLPDEAHAGQLVAGPVSLRDIAATVADVAGLGDSPFPGRSLARYWNQGQTSPEEFCLSEVDAPVQSAPNQGRSPVFRGPMKAVATGNHVYIRNGDGREELYNLESDPRQVWNLEGLPTLGPVLDRFRSELPRLLTGEAGVASRRPVPVPSD